MLKARITDIHAAPDNDHLQRFRLVLAWPEQVPVCPATILHQFGGDSGP